MKSLLKRGRRALILSLVASLTVLSSTADAQPKKPGREITGKAPVVRNEKPVDTAEADFLPQIDDDQDCKKAKNPEKLKQREDKGEKSFTCVESVSFKKEKVDKANGGGNGSDGGDAVAAFAPLQNTASICTSTNTWWYGRKQFCLIVQDLTINVNEVPSGKLLGQAKWRIVHSSGLDARSPQWDNPSSWQVTYKWSDGNNPAWVPDVLTKAENRCTGCAGQSVGNPTAAGQKLALGESAESGLLGCGASPTGSDVDFERTRV